MKNRFRSGEFVGGGWFMVLVMAMVLGFVLLAWLID